MGVMRFLIPPSATPEGWPEVYRAYISGIDGRVFPTRVEVDSNLMVCRRHSNESGRLNVAWPVAGFGRPVLCTSSLVERDAPYVLTVELARGKISQVRDQLGAWEIAGMTVPVEFGPVHEEAHRLFARAAARQENPAEASRIAQDALATACRAAELLTQAYVRQRLMVRRRRGNGLPVVLGCQLSPALPDAVWSGALTHAFNAAFVPIEWRHIEPREGEYHWELNDAQVEWCRENKLLAFGGPLVDLAPDGVPEWLWQWDQDFFNLQSFFCDFVETAITRYIGRIRHWEVAARMNTGGGLALTEENRLTLVARILEVARQVDDENQLLLRIDQPWGDYQARGQHQLSPLQFVDALVRSGVGLSGVNLEIAIGYRPRGSASRDLLEFSRLLDQWGSLGIPLAVTLAFPSSADSDPKSHSDLEVEAPHWKGPWSHEAQAEWLELYLPLLMAKQSVTGIFWTHFSDALPHHFPHAGLLDPDGLRKPALDRIIRFRETYWKPDAE